MGKALSLRIAKIEEDKIKEKENNKKAYEGVTWLEYINGEGKKFAANKVYNK